MRELEVRVPPLEVAEFSEEQARLVGDWTHLNFSRVIVRHPEMYRVFVPYIAQVIAGSSPVVRPIDPCVIKSTPRPFISEAMSTASRA